jgi:hypothetical protein
MDEPADTTLQTAIAAVAGYFAVAVGLTAVFPVVGGCVPTPRGVVTTFSTFSEAKAHESLFVPSTDLTSTSPSPLRTTLPNPRILMGIGAALVLQAVLFRAALANHAAKAADEFPGAVTIDTNTAVRSTQREKGEWDTSGPNQQHHRGWLVLVWGTNAPTPPEKPERGERAFATLANGRCVYFHFYFRIGN